VPILPAVLLIFYSVNFRDWFALLGLALIYLSWIQCAPNFNLVNGCLPIVFTSAFLTTGVWLSSSSLIVLGISCGATWIITSIEAGFRSRPMTADDLPHDEENTMAS
jgi:hypothetical protein